MKRFLCMAFVLMAGFPAIIQGQDSVAVQGWSNDGKVLVVIQYGRAAASTAYTIQDLVTDEVRWSATQEQYDAAVDIPSAKFNIKDNKEAPSDFPLNDKKLGSFDIDIKNMGTTENETKYEAIVSKAGGGGKSLGIFTSWGLRPTGEYKTMWFRSPYENRMLVVVAIEYLHPEFDYKMYDYHFLGCHLGVGFNAISSDPVKALAPLIDKEGHAAQDWVFGFDKNEKGLEFVLNGPEEAGGEVYQIKGCSVKGNNDYLLTLVEQGSGAESQVELAIEGDSARLTAVKNFDWVPDIGKMVFELFVPK